MTRIQIELPDAIAQAAGLFAPQNIARLFGEALRRDQLASLESTQQASVSKPMSEDEIQAEIEAYRVERRAALNATNRT